MDTLFLVLAILGATLVANAAWPRSGPLLLLPSWLLAFLTVDLAFFHLAIQVLVAAGFIWAGVLASTSGKLALIIMLSSSVGLILLWLPNRKAAGAARMIAAEHGLDETPGVPGEFLRRPFSRRRAGVEVERDLEFYRDAEGALKLDLYMQRNDDRRKPVLLYLHGGGWIVGDKKDQGLPLCNHLASLGWACANANYRLCPAATYPDQVVDAKAALAWLRRHADDYGLDPSFIAIAGGSAGGHIAAMTALTPGDATLQPGFEDADTSVQAVVTFYGIYDLTNRLGAHNPQFVTRMVGPLVLKASPDDEPERFTAASPRDQVRHVSQPWLILQGDDDTMAPVAEARDFDTALRAQSQQRVAYAEFPGAIHGFDMYYSPKAIAAVDLTARFLATVLRQAREKQE